LADGHLVDVVDHLYYPAIFAVIFGGKRLTDRHENFPRLYIAAPRRPARSDPQNSQDFRPRAIPRKPIQDPGPTPNLQTVIIAPTNLHTAAPQARQIK
jgi:hypothetical protein